MDLISDIHKKWRSTKVESINVRLPDIEDFVDEFSDKAVVISDLHIPYHRDDLIDKIFTIYGNKGFDLYINGDLFDMECMSSFPKSSNVTLEEEYQIALEMVDKARKQFDHVFLIEGNHERRLRNALMRLPVFVQTSFMFNPDILRTLAYGYVYKGGYIIDTLDFKNVYYTGSYLFKVGDLVLIHPNNYRSTPGSTVRLGVEYVIQFNKEFKHLIMGHTHQIARINYLGVTGYEQGCLTKPLSYGSSGRISLRRNQLGFAEVYFKDNMVEDVVLMDIGNV